MTVCKWYIINVLKMPLDRVSGTSPNMGTLWLSKDNKMTPFHIIYWYNVVTVQMYQYLQWFSSFSWFEYNVWNALLCFNLQFQCTLLSTMHPSCSVYLPTYIHVSTVSNLTSTEVASSHQIRSYRLGNSQKCHFCTNMAFHQKRGIFVL